MHRVLLIEDDKLLRELYTDILKRDGYEVLSVDDAQTALDELDQNEVDVVLLDVMLPGHNGIEVLHELQSFSDWQGLPVIILSARNKHEFGLSDRQWLEYGVVEYIYKPTLQPTQLSRLIKQHITR